MKIGDIIGRIIQQNENTWRLQEAKIRKITITQKHGERCLTKEFDPICTEEIESGTKIMQGGIKNGYVITYAFFELNDITRQPAERWIKQANENLNRLN